eukprot:3755367-Amphidinium_carterae.1
MNMAAAMFNMFNVLNPSWVLDVQSLWGLWHPPPMTHVQYISLKAGKVQDPRGIKHIEHIERDCSH